MGLSTFTTGPLGLVLIGQAIICACHTTSGDTASALQELLTVILGVAIFYHLTPVSVSAYGVSCICGLRYDSAASMNSLRAMRAGAPGVKAPGHASFYSFAILIAPLLSLVGALLTLRMYHANTAGELGEQWQLVNQASKAADGSLYSQNYCSLEKGECRRRDDSVSPPPRMTSPARGHHHKERPAHKPFQAIFDASVESPWLATKSQKAAAAAATAIIENEPAPRLWGPFETRRPVPPVSSPPPSFDGPGSTLRLSQAC